MDKTYFETKIQKKAEELVSKKWSDFVNASSMFGLLIDGKRLFSGISDGICSGDIFDCSVEHMLKKEDNTNFKEWYKRNLDKEIENLTNEFFEKLNSIEYMLKDID